VPQQKFTVNIPKGYTPEERRAIAREIIDFVYERTTEKGLDKDNKKFAKYKKSYTGGVDFFRAGKSGNVDLVLSGEMMAELGQYLRERSGQITIGYDPGDKALNGKVEGNVKGTYGNKKPVQSPRDFLGIHQKDLQKILKKYPLNNEEERLDRVRFIKELEESAEDIVAGLTLDEDFG
jgi:hypothetical protein